MNREIEIKVLDIDPDEIRSRLETAKAVLVGDNVQEIYTYDLPPISTTFTSIKEILSKNIGRKENRFATQQLIGLLADLSDLLSNADESELLNIANAESINDFIKRISIEDIPPVVFEKSFEEIVAKYDTNPNKWVRLRKEGNKSTIALKQIYNRTKINGVRHHSIDGVKEIEIVISDFEKGKTLLEELGYYHKNYQEKRRISYQLPNGVKVDIDFWAHIPPYLEIEAATDDLVYETLVNLGFDRADAKILNADDVYTYYGLDMYSFKELRLH